jgi:acetyl esterase/lipase
LTAISVGYRHAPEDPYPAAVDDCIDAAQYLIDHPEKYGPVRFMGGESAGAYLVVLTTFHLLASRPSHAIEGLALQYGVYDPTLGLPSLTTITQPVMIDRAAMERFRGAFLPGKTPEQCRDPSISPIYADLAGLAAKSPTGLPPALFVVGTDDPLVDDTILMGSKWSIAGAESIVKIYPGATHGFTAVPGFPVAEEANAVSVQFVKDRVTGSK